MHNAIDIDSNDRKGHSERTLRPSRQGTGMPKETDTAGLSFSCVANWPKEELALYNGYFHRDIPKLLQNHHL